MNKRISRLFGALVLVVFGLTACKTKPKPVKLPPLRPETIKVLARATLLPGDV